MVLPEEMIQFQLPTMDTVSVPAGQQQGSNAVCPSKLCCHILPRREQQF